jgi:hypothetical protein
MYTYGALGAPITCQQSYATSDITISMTTDAMVIGGFCGIADVISGSITVNDCYCAGTLDITAGTIQGLGGFAGVNRGNIDKCYAANAITLTAPVMADIGGLIGLQVGGAATACFWDRDLSGLGISAGGTDKTTAEMKTLVTFTDAAWDIQGHKLVDLTNGYPFLSWQIPGSSPVWYIFSVPLPPPISVITLPATEIR